MITAFIILMFVVFAKLIFFAIQMAWGIGKVLLWLIALPFVLVALAFAGLFTLAFPILAIVGLVAILKPLFTSKSVN